jgi:hypothetical protein
MKWLSLFSNVYLVTPLPYVVPIYAEKFIEIRAQLKQCIYFAKGMGFFLSCRGIGMAFVCINGCRNPTLIWMPFVVQMPYRCAEINPSE